ncbi:hypothetical protein [Nocardia sp. bgisy134]|uniref:hypothetical protein n=1 Tax=Nocardia sp. bgisy134 TaxID=3413789 RepID=UPI003D71BC86
MTSQPTVLARTRTLLARLLRAIMLDRPEYRGPNGELTDDEAVEQYTLPPWLWRDPPR